eukprot:TRINITY_DN39408_c0_g1_i1.p1 TRINITY_DN39408_c0_g1~~TRINITY_DN39408_c0_g1_i1.p1  ORF type:complete len:943 (-),score=142.48 TRINITY_DN39408_c0_g1_i1:207-3035(-)
MTELIGAGLRSLAESLVRLDPQLKRLNLHMNRFSTTDEFGKFTDLEELVLSSNCIAVVNGLTPLRKLRALDLSSNNLHRISGLAGLFALERLALAYNSIVSLSGLRDLWGADYCLHTLDLRCNQITGIPQLLALGGLSALEVLRMDKPSKEKEAGDDVGRGNPLAREANYRIAVVLAVPTLRQLDGEDILEDERERSLRKAGLLYEEQGSACVETRLHDNVSDQDVPHDDISPSHEDTSGEAIFEDMLEPLNDFIIELERAQSSESQPSQSFVLGGDSAESGAALHAHVVAEIAMLQQENRSEANMDSRNADIARAYALHSRLAELAPELERRASRIQCTEQEVSVLEAIRASRHQAAECSISAHDFDTLADLKRELVITRDAIVRSEGAAERALRDRERALAALPNRSMDVPELRRELARLETLSADLAHSSNGVSQHNAELHSKVPRLAIQLCEQQAIFKKQARCVEDSESETALLSQRVSAELVAIQAAAVEVSRQEESHAGNEVAQERNMATELEQHLASDALNEARTLEIEVLRAEASLESQVNEVSALHRDYLAISAEEYQHRVDLEARMEAEVQDVRGAITAGRNRLFELRNHLEHHVRTSRLGAEQESDCRYLVSEMSLELEQSRHQEMFARSEVSNVKRATDECMGTEEHFEQRLLMLDGKTAALRSRLAGPSYVRRHDHVACVEALDRLESDVKHAQRRSAAESSSITTCNKAMVNLEEGIKSETDAFLASSSAEERAQLDLRIKQQMVLDARHQIDDVKASTRAEAAKRQKDEVAVAQHLEDTEAEEESWLELLHNLRERLAAADDVARSETTAASVKEQELQTGEREIEELRLVMAERASRANARAMQLRQAAIQVLESAREATAEMERRFREERTTEEREQEVLLAELRRHASFLTQAPAMARAAQERVESERASFARRVSGLLHGGHR